VLPEFLALEHPFASDQEILKIAEIKAGVEPYPHQKRAVTKFRDRGSLLLAHGVGSGKSLSSILIAEDVFKRGGRLALVVVPASLRNNYVDNVRNFSTRRVEVVGSEAELSRVSTLRSSGKALPDFLVVSWDLLRRSPELLASLSPDLLIMDELHHARDFRSANYRAARIVRARSGSALGLTGSVVSNSPDDIPPLLSIVTNGEIPADFPLKSLATRVVGTFPGISGGSRPIRAVTRPGVLQRLGTYIDYLPSSDLMKSGDIPKAVTSYVPVEMSPEQYDAYYKSLKGTLTPEQLQKVTSGTWTSDSDSMHMFTRILKARQLAQSTALLHPTDPERMVGSSPKVQRMVADIAEHLAEDPSHKVVVYSNFVDSGVKPLSYALQKAGISSSVFMGAGRGMRPEEREAQKQAFQTGKNRVLLLSGAGAEGLDLKTGTMFSAMEGHFNPEMVRQAQARVQRMGAQADKPASQRKVLVRRYVSVEPSPGIFQRTWRKLTGSSRHQNSTDEWEYNVAKAKHFTNEGMRISLHGAVPLSPGERPLPPKLLFHSPFKYLRKAYDIYKGRWVYEYPEPL